MGNSALFDCAAHLPFIPICCRGVDMPIAMLQRSEHNCLYLRIALFALEGAQADGGEFLSIVECEYILNFAEVVSDRADSRSVATHTEGRLYSIDGMFTGTLTNY